MGPDTVVKEIFVEHLLGKLDLLLIIIDFF